MVLGSNAGFVVMMFLAQNYAWSLESSSDADIIVGTVTVVLRIAVIWIYLFIKIMHVNCIAKKGS